MKKIKIFISLVVFTAMFLCVNNRQVFATLDATGTLTSKTELRDTTSSGQTISTNHFVLNLDVEGTTHKVDAFCCAHHSPTPDANSQLTGKVFFPGDPEYKREVALAMYYGYTGSRGYNGNNGAGYNKYTGSMKGDELHCSIATSYVISYHTGWGPSSREIIKRTSVTSLLYNYANWLLACTESEPADTPEQIAYFIVWPQGSNPYSQDYIPKQALGGVIAIEQGGDVEIEKIDSHGNSLPGIRFWVDGPDGFTDAEYVTDSEGKIKLTKVPFGTYTFRELETPDKMVTLTVNPEVTISKDNKNGKITVINNYQRGSLKLVKFSSDAEERASKIKGDKSLKGAEFELYAKEEIKEGQQTIYTKDQKITVRYDAANKQYVPDVNGTDKIVTDEHGNTSPVIDLPIGKYYYKETKASPGFLVKETNLEGEVIYKKDSQVAAEKIVECPEDGIHGNLKLTKYLGATDYDAVLNLEGAQFTLTLKSDNTQTYVTNTSLQDGICRANRIPYGTYTVSETTVPVGAMKAKDFDINFTQNNEAFEYEVTDPSYSMKIEIYKKLVDNAVGTTDAKVKGAYFTVYTNPECTQEYKDKNNNTVVIGPTDENGYAISGKMRTKTYYLKETVFPEGINPDAKIPGENVTYREKVYVARGNVEAQKDEVVTLSFTVKNMPDLGSIKVIKYNDDPHSTTETSAKGAILRLELNSNTNCYYDVKLDENGKGEFINPKMQEYYPYTIPYGTYTIKEIKESDNSNHTRFYMRPETVVINKPNQIIRPLIIEDPLVQLYVKVVKMDQKTKKEVAIAGAQFKIWDCQRNKFVELMETPSGKLIDTFSTNSEGYFYTGYVLDAGKYVVYEIKAPSKGDKGYYLEDIYRLPSDPKDYGKKNGKEVILNKDTAGIREDAIKDSTTKMKFVAVEMSDRQVTGKIEVEKKGLMFTDVNQDISDEYGAIKTPKYEERGLQGVTYNIYAAEKITSPDERYDEIPKDGLCGTIVTGENGIGISEELPLGKYYLKEIDAPTGTIINPEPVYVELKYKDQYERVVTEHVSLTNEKQKVELQIPKLFDGTKYVINENEEKYAVFGIYANQTINNYRGVATISKGDLLEVVRVDEKNPTAKTTVDLPEGEYYFKEIYVTDPYVKDETEYKFVVEYDKTNNPKIEIKAPTVVNKPDTSMLYLIKLSSSSFYKGKTLVGIEGINDEEINKEAVELAIELKNKEVEEVQEYLMDPVNGKITLSGAEYSVYLDKECTKPLKEKKDNGEIANVTVKTNEYGMALLENIPLGMYYLKETKAPLNYKIANDVVAIELTQDDRNMSAYRVLYDDMPSGHEIEKVNMFTGDLVPDCTFEVRDESGKVIIHMKTDKDGLAKIPFDLLERELEKGQKYYFVEVDAPDIYKENGRLYKLNTEPHEFTFDYEIDENDQIIFNKKHIINNYKPMRDVLVRKIDEETGKPLPGCKFTIIQLDANGEPYVNRHGENVYAVKDAVTDENGEYLVKNVELGRYKFIEVEAPEGYDLAEQNMEGYELEVRNDSPETIIFEVTNTGDIAVYAITGVFTVSLIGIAYLVLRKRINQV